MRTITVLNELLTNLNGAILNPDFKKQDLLQFYPILELLRKNKNNEQAVLHTQPDKAENNLYLLMDLLFSAIEKKKNDIVDFILNSLVSENYLLLESKWFAMYPVAFKKMLQALEKAEEIQAVETVQNLFQKCYFLVLQKQYSSPSFLRTIASSDLEYSQILDRFIDALLVSCSKDINKSHYDFCIKLLKYLISCEMDHITLYNFLNSQSQRNENHTRWCYLIHSLYLAVERNNKQAIASLESMLLECMIKLDRIALSQLLLKKITIGFFAEKNTLYVLLCALDETKYADVARMNSITQLIRLCLYVCDNEPNELAMTLAAKNSYGSYNALHILMGVLNEAVYHKNDEAALNITKSIQFCFDKRNVDTTLFIAAMSDKITRGDHAGENAWWTLSLALMNAADKNIRNNIENICALMRTCIAMYDNHKDLVAALSATNSKGWNLWFCLIQALFWAMIRRNNTAVDNITKLINEFLEKYHNNTSALIAALVENHISGENALHSLSCTFHFAARQEKEQVIRTATLLHTLLNKFKDDPKILAAALNAKPTTGVNAGKNALYFLAAGLINAKYSNNDDAINGIFNLVQVYLEKYSADATVLMAALFDARVIEAVYRGVCKNDKNVIKNVSGLMQLCIARCDTFSSSLTSYFIGGACCTLDAVERNYMHDKEIQASIFTCILDILAKSKPDHLSERTLLTVFARRRILMPYFKEDYFASKVKQIGLTAMEAACRRGEGETILSMLIDHPNRFFNTNTRNFVSDFICNEKEKTARATQDILRAKQILDNAIAEKNQQLIEKNHEAFKRTLNAAEAIDHTAHIEGKTISELREYYFAAVKNLCVQYPAATVEPVIGSVISSITLPRFFPAAPIPASAAAAAAASEIDDLLRAVHVPRHLVANTASAAKAARYTAVNDGEIAKLEEHSL